MGRRLDRDLEVLVVHPTDDPLADRVGALEVALDAGFHRHVAEVLDLDPVGLLVVLVDLVHQPANVVLVDRVEVGVVDDDVEVVDQGVLDDRVPHLEDKTLAPFAPVPVIEHRAQIVLIDPLVGSRLLIDDGLGPGGLAGSWQPFGENDFRHVPPWCTRGR